MPAESRPRLSLKWKLVGLLALALAAVNSALLYYDYRQRTAEFLERRQHEVERELTVLEHLLERSDQRLQRVGNIVPGIVSALGEDEELEQRWIGLQLELGLQRLQLLDSDGRPLLSGLLDGAAPPAVLTQRIAAAQAAERPDSFLLCRVDCLQYVLTPSVGPAGEARLMIMAANLTDLVLEFPALTGSDIALFAADDDATGPWPDHRLVAVSDAPRNRPRLEALARRHRLSELEASQLLEQGGQILQYSARPWARFGGLGQGYLMIFGDISDALTRIEAQSRQNLAGGLAALLVAILLGLAILNRPMNQVQRLARALPKLADKAYEPARRLIGKDYARRRWPTEIDVLEGLTVDLTDRLEDLEQMVEARNHALAEKVSELRRSQELNETILSTAPILILMLTSNGQIVQVNEFACTLLGYGESELKQRRFQDLIADPRQSRDAANALVDLIAGRSKIFEHSGELRCVDAGCERVTWLHTRVTASAGVFILCLGLPEKATAPESS